ncbi:hypothetical protein FRC10_000353 [Ceratobasidium sp. 414]|nr:hypothetical protein FRC10_000353 [Ceratobasidium sp. 414]
MNNSLPLHFEGQQPDVVAAITNPQVVLGTAAALGAALAWYLLTVNNSRIQKIRGWPLVGQWSFFTKRHGEAFEPRTSPLRVLKIRFTDFVLEGFHKLPNESMFGFNILEHNVVAIRGEEARKTFFDRRDLSFIEGYRLLLGGSPDVKDVVQDTPDRNDQENLSWFIRRLTPLLRMDRLAALTPEFMADLERNMVKWGTSGKFDPFEDVYSIVFQLTIRAAACREIADSVENCKQMEKLYWLVEKGSTPTTVLMPWLPSKARKLKTKATTEIYNWFDNIIKARQAEGRREEDALQVLMDMGDSTADIIQFILGTLFAGIINSGLMSAWIFIFLDQEPQWKTKVIDELRSLLDKYAPASRGYTSAAERFSDIPPEAWEGEMPVLEDCLRETIRLVASGALLRRVIKGDVDLAGKTIPNGYNPGRFAEGQDKSQYHAFLGWGVGRHPCLGRRFAQYEIKAICAMFLAQVGDDTTLSQSIHPLITPVQYDYEIVNSKGVRPDPSTTVPDRNNLYQLLTTSMQARPKDEVFYVKYTKREQML